MVNGNVTNVYLWQVEQDGTLDVSGNVGSLILNEQMRGHIDIIGNVVDVLTMDSVLGSDTIGGNLWRYRQG